MNESWRLMGERFGHDNAGAVFQLAFVLSTLSSVVTTCKELPICKTTNGTTQSVRILPTGGLQVRGFSGLVFTLLFEPLRDKVFGYRR